MNAHFSTPSVPGGVRRAVASCVAAVRYANRACTSASGGNLWRCTKGFARITLSFTYSCGRQGAVSVMTSNKEANGAKGTPSPNLVTIEAEVTAMQNGPRHLFDFAHDGKTCCCFVVSRLMITEKIRPGQRVRMTGEWSTAVQRVFEALSLDLLD